MKSVHSYPVFNIKYLLLIIPFAYFNFGCSGDESEVEEDIPTIETGVVNRTLVVDGIVREYILYIPSSYDGLSPMPLVINYHGLGSNAFGQMLYGDFRTIAEEEEFIVVHPNGTRFFGVTHWNVGGFTNGSTTDDIAFTLALLKEVKASYRITEDKIYATGMSNGGFMSFNVACELSEEFTAIASVTGSMTVDMLSNCQPTTPMPILQIHGTADATVSYVGVEEWNVSIPEVIDYWVSHNNCTEEAEIRRLIDFNPNDDNFIDHFVYANGDNGSVVEHYRINNGTHSWPGTAFGEANRDINASELIWEFFSRY